MGAVGSEPDGLREHCRKSAAASVVGFEDAEQLGSHELDAVVVVVVVIGQSVVVGQPAVGQPAVVVVVGQPAVVVVVGQLAVVVW
jgi:hypothetical protein